MKFGRLQIDILAGHCIEQYGRILVKVSTEDLYGAVSQVNKNFEYVAVYRADMHFHVVAHAIPSAPCGICVPSYNSQRFQLCSTTAKRLQMRLMGFSRPSVSFERKGALRLGAVRLSRVAITSLFGSLGCQICFRSPVPFPIT
jgi:hypothetical protein